MERFPTARYSQRKLELLLRESEEEDRLLAFDESFSEASWKLASKMGQHRQAF